MNQKELTRVQNDYGPAQTTKVEFIDIGIINKCCFSAALTQCGINECDPHPG